MKRFYLLRHEDVHGRSGTGVVAEGIVFDTGLAAMNWLSKHSTVTVFANLKTVKELHGHEGKTEIVVECKHPLFEECQRRVREMRSKAKRDYK